MIQTKKGNDMPQKPIYSRYPLMNSVQSGLSRGLVRTEAGELISLYRKLNEFTGNPYTWEGAFSLACLICDHPADEPSAKAVNRALADTEDGSFAGIEEADQISAARAALALFEYTGDKEILKRLAKWCRWLEARWDRFTGTRWVRVQPADLMEFLVRFYRISGLKAVLRLCSRLRSAAMDWTTALHHFQQRTSLNLPDSAEEMKALYAREDFTELDFFNTQYLTNHAEILADGMRYTAYSAIYSGNGQEMSAGRKGWEYIHKHHGAVCGGTTANVLLAGRGANQGIHPAATAAWTEAMISQMHAGTETWAVNELVRLAYNGLADCLNHAEKTGYRFVNWLGGSGDSQCFDPVPEQDRDMRTAARLARAAAAVWQYAVTTGTEEIRLNYLMPGRYYVTNGNQSAILTSDGESVHFRCKESVDINLLLFCAETETADISVQNVDGTEIPASTEELIRSGGGYLRIRRSWENLDTLIFHQGDRIYTEETQHQGICVFTRNRLMSLDVSGAEYRYAVFGKPCMKNGKPFVPMKRISRWPAADGIPSDIPVLPAGKGEAVYAPLTGYADTAERITIFPREARYE